MHTEWHERWNWVSLICWLGQIKPTFECWRRYEERVVIFRLQHLRLFGLPNHLKVKLLHHLADNLVLWADAGAHYVENRVDWLKEQWLVGGVAANHDLAQVVDCPDHVLREVHFYKSALIVYFWSYFLVQVELFARDALRSLVQAVMVDCVVWVTG